MKIVFIYILLFLFFYIQPISIGGVKISFVTNGALILLILNFLLRNQVHFNKIGKIGIYNAIKIIFSKGFVLDFVGVIIECVKSLMLPLVHLYFSNSRFCSRLFYYLIFLCKFLVISSIPFLIGIIQPIKQGYDLSFFGQEDGGFVGFFENSHSSSACISLAILVLIFNFINRHKSWNPSRKFFEICVILLGLYVLYSTYVRTGYLMVFIGSIVLFVGYFRSQYLVYYFFVFSILAFLATYMFNRDEVLRNKLLDNYENSNTEEDNLGSGRILFLKASFDIWLEANSIDKIFGLGLQEYKEEMFKKVGQRIYAHNGFVSALVKDGLVGFLLYVYFIGLLIVESYRSNSHYRLLALSVSLAYLAYQMVQGNVISQIM